MASFDIVTHIIPASHIREYARGTTSAYSRVPRLQLVVNQYTPKINPNPKSGDFTVVFCHANGFHKELYEPYFDDLLAACEARGLRIRAILAADAAHQGASGILNERYLGDGVCWNDYARDVLHMINVFAPAPPIIGIGHSFGGHAIGRIAAMHPSVFASLVLLDPVLQEQPLPNPGLRPAKASAQRKDTWSTLAKAKSYFQSHSFYKIWDPRVLDIHIVHGLRTLPDGSFTLATSKEQEVFTFLDCTAVEGFMPRIEPKETFDMLPRVKIPVLYIVGEQSPFTNPDWNRRKLEVTPHSEMEVCKKAGHLVTQEQPIQCALISAKFLERIMVEWKTSAEADDNTPRSKVIRRKTLQALAKL